MAGNLLTQNESRFICQPPALAGRIRTLPWSAGSARHKMLIVVPGPQRSWAILTAGISKAGRRPALGPIGNQGQCPFLRWGFDFRPVLF